MYKRLLMMPMAAMLILLAACSSGGSAGNNTDNTAESKPKRSVEYLGNSYQIPARTKQIALVGSHGTYEDALLLGIPPFAATTDKNGTFPHEYATITQNATHLPWNVADNITELTTLAPDVILTTDKTSAEDIQKLQAAGTVIPVSTNGAYWADNLRLVADVRGREENVDTLIHKLTQNTQTMHDKLVPLKDKQVLTVWYQEGDFFVYPENERYNHLLYTELALTLPDIVAKAKERTPVSMEMLTQADPDYLFVMVDKIGAPTDSAAFDQLQQSAPWADLKAVKANQAYVNAVDPVLAGGTVYSNQQFLMALQKHLLK
ncbi:iron-uptake system-binding protein [Brevibacillus reuszeri]|uniref:ABC transporter substrate-binding protein n=1 Tax=Brevibacillus reuszeri TaxID=54915 RepID=A0A0K9YXT9_9BACL|nr:ABC transporter substrate-binding protein [Brevibacillus reuszeri]KNB73472.1 ABC transporter substrate-binding protein [Brevibacillus reuszeri]MED1858739.1 ABC transporter substrate-binding protein [Brevibacillus reuszeri]GED69719.1 iron-uptake system-binding protein [Brevibacillus reuszeri]